MSRIPRASPGTATYADCTWLDMNFTLIDTGGIEPDAKDIILPQMEGAGGDRYFHRRM